MKYFVFSDIHGHYQLLINELKKVGFDINNDNHMLISIGDNFDRGKENIEVYQYLKELKEKNKIILIKGNHEDLLIELLERGYPLSRDYSNGTYDTLNEFYKKIFNVDADIKNNDYLDLYKKLKEEGFLDFIYEMLDYYETPNYIFTHGFIPIDGQWNYYFNSNCVYNPNWRDSNKEQFKQARWINGMEMSMKYNIKEPNKKIVVGHYHTSYGNIRKDLKEEMSDTILKKMEFINFDLFEPYIDDKLIAIDACTILTKRINILVIED